MAPELQAAAERIFREGYRAGLGGGLAGETLAYERWRAQQPGYRPLPRPTRQERETPSYQTNVADSPPSWNNFPIPAFDSSAFDVVSDPTPSSDTGWGGSDFSGGGDGSGGGAGASGDW